MKKLVLAILGIAIIASIYYFSKGSEQLSAEMKTQMNNELVSLQSQGFSVQTERYLIEKNILYSRLMNLRRYQSFLHKKVQKLILKRSQHLKDCKSVLM